MEFEFTPQFFYLSAQGKIHYRYLEISGAPTVVILPGFTMPSALYLSMAKELHKNENSVIIVDYWGRGHSESRSDKNYNLDSHIFLVVSLLRHLMISKCSFIGVSYGSAVLARLAVKRPELIDKMVFISPLHFTYESPSSLQKFALGTPTIGPILLRFTASRVIPFQIASQIADKEKNSELISKISNLCLQQFIGPWVRTDAISRAIAQFEVTEVEQAFAALANVNKRILVFLGCQDSLINISDCKAWWSRWIQNANIQMVDDAGHLLFVEKEDEVAKSIKAFLSL